MAYLSKEAYDRKREWAARKHKKQKCVTALSEEQHEVLAELCRIRHELHCNKDAFFITGRADYRSTRAYFPNEIGDGRINEDLASVGLPIIRWSHSFLDFPDDNAWQEGGYEDWDEAYEAARDMAEDLNSNIEDYLRNIDEEYGTEYAPSGATRIF